MGEVYLAQHPRLPRRDALKLLPAEWSADADYRARFTREADLASTLWHPHIVGVHDRGETDGQLWIAMDFVDGVDGARLLADRYPAGMPVDEVVRIVTAVAGGLDYAHKQGLLHRDVKPPNIMLTHTDDDTDDRRILLTDFGIARDVNDISGLTATNITVGTVAYSAPEQLMGEDHDGRADQYSLAATAYHLLTGSHLFPHSNPAVVISRHLNGAPPALADKRPELADIDPILQAALAKDPADRFGRCSDFARALAEQAHTSGLPAASVPTAPAPLRRPTTSAPPAPVPASPTPRVGDRIRRRWLVPAASAGAVLVLAVAAILFWRPWQRADHSGATASQAAPTSTLTSPPPSSAAVPPATAPPSSTTATSVAAAALPATPPVNSGCRGTVTAHHDIEHKTSGPVRIFLTVNTEAQADSEGCIAAVTNSGAVLPPVPLDVRETFRFANPATDATGNTFITYNPGRYDGVLVLIPDPGGFEDIGWDDTYSHYSGRHAYYYVELVGPGSDGMYTIRQSSNDCTPSCAEGAVTSKILHWNGSDYIP
jgi:serine/threonine-protein kinase